MGTTAKAQQFQESPKVGDSVVSARSWPSTLPTRERRSGHVIAGEQDLASTEGSELTGTIKDWNAKLRIGVLVQGGGKGRVSVRNSQFLNGAYSTIGVRSGDIVKYSEVLDGNGTHPSWNAFV